MKTLLTDDSNNTFLQQDYAAKRGKVSWTAILKNNIEDTMDKWIV